MAELLPSKQQVVDYLDHPPQRYTFTGGSYVTDNPRGEWVKHADMDLYMLEGGQLMQQMADEHNKLSAKIERLTAQNAHTEQLFMERSLEVERLCAALHRMAFAHEGVAKHWQDFAIHIIQPNETTGGTDG
jgi:hypothetical protein